MVVSRFEQKPEALICICNLFVRLDNNQLLPQATLIGKPSRALKDSSSRGPAVFDLGMHLASNLHLALFSPTVALAGSRDVCVPATGLVECRVYCWARSILEESGTRDCLEVSSCDIAISFRPHWR